MYNLTTNIQPDLKMARGSKQTFHQRRHTDVNRHMKRCSISLIMGRQIKTTMRFYFILVRMVQIKKSRKEVFIQCCWEWKTMENSKKIPQRLKIKLSDDPVIPLMDIYLNNMKILNQKHIHKFIFIVSLFPVAME